MLCPVSSSRAVALGESPGRPDAAENSVLKRQTMSEFSGSRSTVRSPQEASLKNFSLQEGASESRCPSSSLVAQLQCLT